MRATDPDPPPWQPLGERVIKPKPAAPHGTWTPLEHNPHVGTGPDGRLSTNLPLPPTRKDTP